MWRFCGVIMLPQKYLTEAPHRRPHEKSVSLSCSEFRDVIIWTEEPHRGDCVFLWYLRCMLHKGAQVLGACCTKVDNLCTFVQRAPNVHKRTISPAWLFCETFPNNYVTEHRATQRDTLFGVLVWFFCVVLL